MSARFIDSVLPDALLALQLDTGSAVLALEVDEGTEHAPVIRAELARYAAALDGRDGWHIVFVVGEPERARWIVRLARDTKGLDGITHCGWVTTIEQLRHRSTAAQLASLVGRRSGAAARVSGLAVSGTISRPQHAGW